MRVENPACSTGPTGSPTPTGTLRGGQTCPCGGGVTAGTLVIGELDHAEQRELL